MQELEILFRGKTYDGKWEQGDLRHGGYVHNDSETYMMRADYALHNIPVDPKTVGQYTGLTDKNGVKIFEGDILKCNDNPMDLVKAVFGEFVVIDIETERRIDTVIGWHYEVIPTDELSKIEPFCFAMPLTAHYVEVCSMEVIGNIHDNPELLKV